VARLSNRYATALFELSTESNRLEENMTQATFLCELLSDEQFRNVITHPRISLKEKRDIFNVALNGFSMDLQGFLFLAIDKNREKFILPALSEFIELGNRHIRKTTAQIVTAVPLNDKQAETLVSLLSQKLNKTVDLAIKVDPFVIGGLYVQVDGYYVDNTVKSRLQDMKIGLST
jgi:F-type H+-transporting ATPase subunit delta